MTNEEAIELVPCDEGYVSIEADEYWAMRRDLEVLSIIKNHFPMHIYDEDRHGCVLCVESPELKCAYAELDGYEKDVMKRWLEEK